MVLDLLGQYPGVPGLFMACVFSAALRYAPRPSLVHTTSLSGTHHVPLRYTPRPSQVHTTSLSGTHHIPLRYTPCPSQVHTASLSGTHRIPLRYAPCPSQVRTMSLSGTHHVPLRYAPRPSQERASLPAPVREVRVLPVHRAAVKTSRLAPQSTRVLVSILLPVS